MSAIDELRFGPQRTLNLREHLPSAAEAVRRTEGWLREQQLRGAGEVLVITGRGSHSPGGVPVIRGAVEKLLFTLRRRGVVASHGEHNPGAFAVRLAPLRALAEAPARRRDRMPAVSAPAQLSGLGAETHALLRELAERSLEALGVSATERQIADEMHHHLRQLAPALPGGDAMEPRLQAALRIALAEYD